MQRYILVRLGQAVITLLVMMLLVFFLIRLTGDPASQMLPQGATVEDAAALRSHLGLDKPVAEQFGIFMRQVVTGDLGNSIVLRMPVTTLLLQRLPNSVRLSLFAMSITLLIAFPFGVMAAVNRGRALDFLARGIAAVGQSLPQFWLGLVLMQFFAIKLGLLPIAQMGGFSSYILPGFTLSVYVMASVTRLLRSSMLEILDSDFITEARAKGVSESIVVWKHALRNALIPVVTFTGMYITWFIMSAVVVEMIFAWPGIGSLLIQGIVQRDYPVIQGVILFMTFLIVIANLAVDISYAYIDPRIRY